MFEKYITSDEILFKHARGKSVTKGTELHPFHEILFFADGEADFLSENERFNIKRGTLFIIPEGNFHEFYIKNPETYERCLFNFTDTEELIGIAEYLKGGIKIVENPDEEIKKLFTVMANSFDKFSSQDRKLLMKSVLNLLLLELKVSSEQMIVPESREQNTLIAKALEYIGNTYLFAPDIREIAGALNVSASALTHCFRHELNVSVHHYISEKRLMYAQKQITEGLPPTEIYHKCGYRDYSAFFRAYKKRFGKSPSEK